MRILTLLALAASLVVIGCQPAAPPEAPATGEPTQRTGEATGTNQDGQPLMGR